LPQYWERVQKPLIRFEKQAIISEAELREKVTSEVAQEAEAAGEFSKAQRAMETERDQSPETTGSIRAHLLQMVQGAGGRFTQLAFNTAQIAVVLVTVFFGVIFTLMNPHPVFRAFFYIVPADQHDTALRILRRIAEFVPRWALATLLAMLTIGVLVFFLMWPIFGFFDALILGVIAGALEAVPYLGPVLSAVPAVLLGLGKGGLTPVWVILAYIVVQALENNVVSPLIMARSMRLHPLAVIFAMLVSVAAFGVLGVLVAAPVVAILQIIYDEVYRERFLPGVTDDRVDEIARRALYEPHPKSMARLK
jgi:predicted PurR-regulated permease PerM